MIYREVISTKRKKITGRIFVSINGEDVLWDTLSQEKKEEISYALNKRAVKAFLEASGYIVKEKPA